MLAKKYNKSTNEIKVIILKQDESHVAGSVLFGQGGPGEGGLVLAVKIDNVWEIVYDGNGSVDCNKLKNQYDFSDDLLRPEFCD